MLYSSLLGSAMAKPTKKIDPLQIFMHADGFYKAEKIISNIDFNSNPQLAAEVAQAAMVLSALNSELFLKCIICIETGKLAHGHHLGELFGELRPQTRKRIEHIWDTELVPFRNPMWMKIENSFGDGRRIARDLLSALTGGSTAFEKIRYSYEPDNEDVQFYIGDLPRILGRVILEMKPEWRYRRRAVQEVSPADPMLPPGGQKPEKLR
jgi:hypothetical protein